MRLGAATPLEDILEADWQRQVEQLARTLGWKLWHCCNARRSDFGWPDLALCRDRLILLELKREKGKPTEQQCDWIRALINAGAEIYIARPRDLDALALILASRRPPHEHRDPKTVAAATRLRDTTRKETA